MIYKTAIDFAREKNYQEIVELLEKAGIDDIELLKKKIQKKDDEIKLLKSFLFSAKEKPTSFQFFDYNDYKVESVIGEGRKSSVKLVTKKKQYAQKELKEFTFEQAKRFFSECEILFKLHHPCIIRVFGFNNGDETHLPSIILSLESTTLEKAIEEKNLDNKQKNRITVEIVLGMRYIHKKKLIHRNLKPSNILLSKNNHVRISDFGLAKEDGLEISQSDEIVTMKFMAPELFEENEDEEDEDGDKKQSNFKYTNKIDIFQFGITLIFIVTEKYPPSSISNAADNVELNLKGIVVDWVQELIHNCLSHSPDDRPSFDEIFEIMKSHNYDMFNECKSGEMTSMQRNQKKEIENRILKIEAFEYQHQDE